MSKKPTTKVTIVAYLDADALDEAEIAALTLLNNGRNGAREDRNVRDVTMTIEHTTKKEIAT